MKCHFDEKFVTSCSLRCSQWRKFRQIAFPFQRLLPWHKSDHISSDRRYSPYPIKITFSLSSAAVSTLHCWWPGANWCCQFARTTMATHDSEITLYRNYVIQINGLVQERRNSIANALELRLCCTIPSKVCCINMKYYTGGKFCCIDITLPCPWKKNHSVRRTSADGWQLFDFYSNQVGSRAQTPINAECQYAHNQINSLDWQS